MVVPHLERWLKLDGALPKLVNGSPEGEVKHPVHLTVRTVLEEVLGHHFVLETQRDGLHVDSLLLI